MFFKTKVSLTQKFYLPTRLFLVLMLLCLPQFALQQSKYSSRLVKTAYGSVRGIIMPPSKSLMTEVEAFLGIPYASAPVASLRFMPPLTPSHWEGIKVADQYGPSCPQILPDVTNRSQALSKMPLLKFTRFLDMNKLLANQSEDCLYLNIYMPVSYESQDYGYEHENENKNKRRSDEQTRKHGLLPIVVILQGESWEWGSGNLIDGSALASYGHVAVISLNYRLGILGFLQTSNQQGNFAIMDIVAALHWIRENAEAFGGDVNRVTLMGHKTGAVLANFLMLAPVATELFHRVILLSGSALSPWAFQRHSKTNIKRLAQFFECTKEAKGKGGSRFGVKSLNHAKYGANSFLSRTKGLLEQALHNDIGPCLRELPLPELLSAVTAQLTHPRFLARFGPIIDSSVVKPDFVSDMKYDKSGHFSKVPLLMGTSTIESFVELNTEDIEDGLSDKKRDKILRTFVRNVFVYHLNEIYSTIKNEYTDWEKPRKDYIDIRDSVLNILSDGLTVAPLIQVASMHSSRKNTKTYFFHFQYEADQSFYPNRIGSISNDLMEFAIGHALSDHHQSNKRSLPSHTPKDASVAKSVLRYLSNFVISGDPNIGHDGSINPKDQAAQLPFWDSYDPINQFYLEIGGGKPKMKSHYRGHKMALWLNLIPQLHQSGGPDVSMLHHTFRDDKPEYYEGIVRETPKHLLIHYPSIFFSADEIQKNSVGIGGGKSGGSVGPGNNGDPNAAMAYEHENDDFMESQHLSEEYDGDGDMMENGYFKSRSSNSNSNSKIKNYIYTTLSPALMSSSECAPNASDSSVVGSSHDSVGPDSAGSNDGDQVKKNHNVGGNQKSSHKEGSLNSRSEGSDDQDLVRQLAAAHYHSYGTALGVTIGVGCCLLLLNLLIFLAIYHQKTHNIPPASAQDMKEMNDDDEENHIPLPSTLERSRGGHGVVRHIGNQMSSSVPVLYSDENTDDCDEDIVQELHERHSNSAILGGSIHSSSYRINSKDVSSSSGFSSPSIPDPPPPPRIGGGGAAGGAVTFASLTRGSVRVLRRDDSRDFNKTGTC